MRLTPLNALKRSVAALEKLPCRFCLIGGHAASLYRAQERFTDDVDFALVASPKNSSRAVAESVIKNLGIKPMVGVIPLGKNERARPTVCMITSEPAAKDLSGIVDILLPEVPWVPEAVERAQSNIIDLGFAGVPVITPEDLILAKCLSLANAPDRFQDLDDLKHLFKDVKDLDIDYIRRRLGELSLVIPEIVASHAPPSLIAPKPKQRS
jgi:hypothetical protein